MLEGRGVLEVGNYADINVFNLYELKENATFTDPCHYSSGMDYVIVNGKPTDQWNRSAMRRDAVSVIYQNYNLFPLLTVAENIRYPLELKKMNARQARELAKQMRQRVELPDSKFLTASLFAYVVPLVLFLGGFFLGNALTGSEGLTVLFGLIGLALGCVAVYFINKAISRREDWRPHVSAVYDSCPEQAQMGCNGGK